VYYYYDNCYRTLAGRLKAASDVDCVAEETVSRHCTSNDSSDNRPGVDSNAHMHLTANSTSQVICAADIDRRSVMSIIVGRQMSQYVERHVCHVDSVVGIERWNATGHHV